MGHTDATPEGKPANLTEKKNKKRLLTLWYAGKAVFCEKKAYHLLNQQPIS